MQSTTKERAFKKAFHLSPSIITNIWTLLTEDDRKARVEFSCSDGSEIQSDDLRTLLDFPNSEARRILSLTLETTYESGSPSIRVAAHENWASEPRIEYSVAGDDREVIHRSAKIEEILSNAFVWYSPLAVIPVGVEATVSSLLFVTGMFSALAGLSAVFGTASKLQSQKIVGLNAGSVFVVLGLLLLVLAGYGRRLIRWLFPPAAFLIGGGMSRASRAEFWRWAVCGTLVLGVIGSLIATAISGSFAAHP